MIAQLAAWDQALFQFINGWHSPFMDTIMWLISTRWAWIPVYLFLLGYLYHRWGWRPTLAFLGLVGLTILMSDQLASGLLKPWVARFRPCQPEAGLEGVHLVEGHCGGLYGFVSSHAANFFALATLLASLFRWRRISWLFFFLAALVAYSRVYLGVHYPGDVLVGALLGLCVALIAWRVYWRWLPQPWKEFIPTQQ